MEFLFVYGTLQRPGNSHMADFLALNAEVIAEGFFYGRLYDLTHYPGAVRGKNPDGKVYGTIYKLNNPEKVLPVLDEYEAVEEGLYVRGKIPVFISEEEIECWVYLYNQPTDNLSQIISGNYNKHLRK